jgi:CHAT domain-containing protein/tetratricopeptide (TPR) repeat protein
MGQLAEARELLEEAGELREAAGDRRGLGITLSSLGAVLAYLGELDRSFATLERALGIAEELKDDEGKAAALSNLGVAYEWSGQPLVALEHCRSSLEINERIGHRSNQAEVLINLGTTYMNLGDLEQAETYYQKAVDLNNELGRHVAVAKGLINLGWVQALAGKPEPAVLSLERAVAVLARYEQPFFIAAALEKLGRTRIVLGDTESAETALEQGLKIASDIGALRRQSRIQLGLGELWEQRKQPAKAGASYARAEKLSRQGGDLFTTIDALAGQARCRRNQGRLAAAQQMIEQALALVESVRSRAGGDRLRASFLATRSSHYRLAVELAMERHRREPGTGHDRAAFRFHQRMRSRSLLDLVAGLEITPSANLDESLELLLKQERLLRRQLNAGELQLDRLSQHEADDKKMQQLMSVQGERIRRHSELVGSIRRQSHGYAALLDLHPLSLAEIQQHVLDAGTVLLVYALGEQSSYLWSVTPASFSVLELPPAASIEARARRFIELLTLPAGIYQATSLRERRSLQEKLAAAEAEYATVASQLSSMLLAPVSEKLHGKRLAIMAEGALQYLPFSALPAPGTERPLMADHEIVYLPSASVLGLTRQELAGRPPAAKMLAVLADPVLNLFDQRLASSGSNHAAGNEMLRGLPVRLTYSAREAASISALLPADQVLLATGFEATRNVVIGGELARYRIVHFATHGTLHHTYPELSGLLLSLFDRQGRPVNGHVRLHDIYSLRLNADLVVLSACQTGIGHEVPGEGLIGLTRGFFHAGAPRIVASLWPVNDAATAELMSLFYDRMLRQQLRPADALRRAQLTLRQAAAEKRWHHPYYWAGFVLYGEWQ